MISDLVKELRGWGKARILAGGLAAVLLFGAGRLCWRAAWDIPVRFSGCSSFLGEPKECLAPGEDWNIPQVREKAENRARSLTRWRLLMLPAFILAGLLSIPAFVLAAIIPPPEPGFLWQILAAGLYFCIGAAVVRYRAGQ